MGDVVEYVCVCEGGGWVCDVDYGVFVVIELFWDFFERVGYFGNVDVLYRRYRFGGGFIDWG